MFEKFTARDAADFRQRYLGTYGFFRKGDRKTLVRLTNIETGNDKVVQFNTKDNEKCFLYPDSEDDTVGFEFIPPKRGYHNTPQGTFLLSRIPARQYLRGICDKNTSIRTVAGQIVPVGFDTLSALFENNISPIERLLSTSKASKTEERSVALSGQFAISLDTQGIYCLGKHIGQVDHVDVLHSMAKSFVVTLTDPSLWTVEITDALKRAGIQGVVK